MSKLMNGLAVASLVAGLCACTTPTVPGANDNARLSTDRFKTAPVSQPEEVRLAIHAQGLSAAQSAALASLVERWRAAEAGTITVRAPADGVDSAAGYRMSEAARSALLSHGVPADQIQVVSYRSEGEASPPLRVGYLAYQAVIPKCGETWTNFTASMDNDVQPNFGCSVTANVAAMVANPADMAAPRAMSPQDATRRQVVLDKYRKGEVTSAAVDEKAKGVVSKAIQ